MIPLNGGAQAYLAYAYNPLISYLYTWTAVSVLKPGGNAIIALIFGFVELALIFSWDVFLNFGETFLQRISQ